MKINIKVIPNSKRSEVEETENGLKIKVKAKPVDGAANKEVIQLLARHLKTRETNVKIIHGHKSNKKTVEIS